MLARAVVAQARAVLGAALEVVGRGAGPLEERADGDELVGQRLVRGARDRELVGGQVVGDERQRLQRLRRRADVRDQVRVAPGLGYGTVADEDRVHPVPRLDDVPAGRGTLIASTRRKTIPEFPEVEAARQALDEPVARSPVAQGGPAHIATLKTFDPLLTALEGRRCAGARRRGKHLFPTADDEPSSTSIS